MNALLLAFGGLQPIVDAPAWVVLLLKLTAILSAAWLAHLAIARTNPRWRVVLWRVTAVGLIAMPAVACLLPSLEIRVAAASRGRRTGSRCDVAHDPVGRSARGRTRPNRVVQQAI